MTGHGTRAGGTVAATSENRPRANNVETTTIPPEWGASASGAPGAGAAARSRAGSDEGRLGSRDDVFARGATRRERGARGAERCRERLGVRVAAAAVVVVCRVTLELGGGGGGGAGTAGGRRGGRRAGGVARGGGPSGSSDGAAPRRSPQPEREKK